MRGAPLLLLLLAGGGALAAEPAAPAPPASAQAAPAVAAPNTLVTFKDPDKFIDAGTDGIGSRTSPQVLDALKKHLQQLGARWLPAGQTLQITVTDIDLAGRFDPRPGRDNRVRIMRDGDWPRIDLHYTLKQDGRTLQDADAHLSDMSYLMNSGLTRSDDWLRYEKSMLDRWFAKTFAGRP
ncbi:DUF3016 domain-containing protein [Solimonas soli]|uniref:DUF3016 domain-containing protein n=1 Tax=Solimonas soli TaxID=413479 RepID=UPI000A0375DD|nr:DUF3016 domain-containing protein [Solimonas soli]